MLVYFHLNLSSPPPFFLLPCRFWQPEGEMLENINCYCYDVCLLKTFILYGSPLCTGFENQLGFAFMSVPWQFILLYCKLDEYSGIPPRGLCTIKKSQRHESFFAIPSFPSHLLSFFSWLLCLNYKQLLVFMLKDYFAANEREMQKLCLQCWCHSIWQWISIGVFSLSGGEFCILSDCSSRYRSPKFRRLLSTLWKSKCSLLGILLFLVFVHLGLLNIFIWSFELYENAFKDKCFLFYCHKSS